MLSILNDAPRFSPPNLLLRIHFSMTFCVISAVSSTVKLQIKSNLSAETQNVRLAGKLGRAAGDVTDDGGIITERLRTDY